MVLSRETIPLAMAGVGQHILVGRHIIPDIGGSLDMGTMPPVIALTWLPSSSASHPGLLFNATQVSEK